MNDDLFTPGDRVLFRRAIDKWGLDAQLDQAVEEAAETIVAINHLKRGRLTPHEAMEELAQLRIVEEQLIQHIGRDVYEDHINRELRRLRGRLYSEDGEEERSS